ncbi:LytR/AlgR family response regulator transcription factor [Lysobacter silvisoli]|uniref:DNA-binding response regulator n=1 Tax=Lysobacter silvisoli TaxID=2293254 RepID=A0A371K013_9GAMM|nr:LytTR family DNA-binding domain-containing protein [Lysobacter silvisoli]RDZ27259.1 DNA-binding response regulator [Lysobacter silvisoli]
MIRVAVIDDEPLARDGVIARLAEHSDIEVVAQYGDGPAALAGLREISLDLAFVDVQMPELNGLDVLAALPPAQRPLAILLTAYDAFAIRAFALNAVDYLLKPVDEERFAEALERARQMLAWRRRDAHACADDTVAAAPRPASRLAVRIGRREVYVDVDDIEWIQADGDYASLHVDGRTYLLRESLHRLSARLNPERFVRVHRSSIVRADQVVELRQLINRDAVLRLRDGTPLRVSRTYIDRLTAVLRECGGSV